MTTYDSPFEVQGSKILTPDTNLNPSFDFNQQRRSSKKLKVFFAKRIDAKDQPWLINQNLGNNVMKNFTPQNHLASFNKPSSRLTNNRISKSKLVRLSGVLQKQESRPQTSKEGGGSSAYNADLIKKTHDDFQQMNKQLWFNSKIKEKLAANPSTAAENLISKEQSIFTKDSSTFQIKDYEGKMESNSPQVVSASVKPSSKNTTFFPKQQLSHSIALSSMDEKQYMTNNQQDQQDSIEVEGFRLLHSQQPVSRAAASFFPPSKHMSLQQQQQQQQQNQSQQTQKSSFQFQKNQHLKEFLNSLINKKLESQAQFQNLTKLSFKNISDSSPSYKKSQSVIQSNGKQSKGAVSYQSDHQQARGKKYAQVKSRYLLESKGTGKSQDAQSKTNSKQRKQFMIKLHSPYKYKVQEEGRRQEEQRLLEYESKIENKSNKQVIPLKVNIFDSNARESDEVIDELSEISIAL